MSDENNAVVMDPSKTRKIEAGGATFWLSVPTVADRTAFRRQLSVSGVRTYDQGDMERAFQRGIKAVYAHAPAERDELISALATRSRRIALFYDRVRKGEYADNAPALVQEWVAASTMGDRLEDAEIMVARGHEPYRVMCAEREIYPVAMGQVAAMLFLVGWDGVFNPETGAPVPFTLNAAGAIDLAMLASLSNEQLAAIGEAVDGMCDVKPSKVKR